MSQTNPADPNREVADDERDQELAKRDPGADPGADAAEATDESSATAGD
jgi:hypothetical protein